MDSIILYRGRSLVHFLFIFSCSLICVNNLGAYNGSSAPGGGYTLFVYNIGTDGDERALWQLFSPFGLIDKVSQIF